MSSNEKSGGAETILAAPTTAGAQESGPEGTDSVECSGPVDNAAAQQTRGVQADVRAHDTETCANLTHLPHLPHLPEEPFNSPSTPPSSTSTREPLPDMDGRPDGRAAALHVLDLIRDGSSPQPDGCTTCAAGVAELHRLTAPQPVDAAGLPRPVDAILADLAHPYVAVLSALNSNAGSGPIGRLLQDVPALLAALAARSDADQLRTENERLSGLVDRQLGECIGCKYDEGPDEVCPHHGRSYSEWVQIASDVIGRSNQLRSENDDFRTENRAVWDRVDAEIDKRCAAEDERDAARVEVAELTENGRWIKPQVSAKAWEAIVRQAVTWPEWDEFYATNGGQPNDETMVSFLAAEHETAAAARVEVDRLTRERDEAREKVRAAELLHVWTNEDGKRFVFVNDLAVALRVPGYQEAL